MIKENIETYKDKDSSGSDDEDFINSEQGKKAM